MEIDGLIIRWSLTQVHLAPLSLNYTVTIAKDEYDISVKLKFTAKKTPWHAYDIVRSYTPQQLTTLLIKAMCLMVTPTKKMRYELMATIQKRKKKDGTYSYRVMIRASDGFPTSSKIFPTRQETKDWRISPPRSLFSRKGSSKILTHRTHGSI